MISKIAHCKDCIVLDLILPGNLTELSPTFRFRPVSRTMIFRSEEAIRLEGCWVGASLEEVEKQFIFQNDQVRLPHI